MNLKEWAKKEVELAKLAEYVEPLEGKNDNEREIFRIENAYAESVYDAALEIFNKFVEQDHSVMSIHLTLTVVNRLVQVQTLTPLQGTDDEWDAFEDWNDGYLIAQNNRNTKVFKRIYPDGSIIYSYNESMVIVNSDEVWQKYPPLDEPGVLDDGHPLVMNYIEEKQRVRQEMDGKISFPYMPISNYFIWDFENEKLVPSNNKGEKI